jgi:hypothetical protein
MLTEAQNKLFYNEIEKLRKYYKKQKGAHRAHVKFFALGFIEAYWFQGNISNFAYENVKARFKVKK